MLFLNNSTRQLASIATHVATTQKPTTHAVATSSAPSSRRGSAKSRKSRCSKKRARSARSANSNDFVIDITLPDIDEADGLNADDDDDDVFEEEAGSASSADAVDELCCFDYFPLQKSAIILASALIAILSIWTAAALVRNGSLFNASIKLMNIACLALILLAYRWKKPHLYVPFFMLKGLEIGISIGFVLFTLSTGVIGGSSNERTTKDWEKKLFFFALLMCFDIWAYSVFFRAWRFLRLQIEESTKSGCK